MAHRYYTHTNDLGRALFDGNYPLLGAGSNTLVFEWDENYVIKVPHNRRGHYQQSWQERHKDLNMYKLYPKCFAKTVSVWFYVKGKFTRAVLQEKLRILSQSMTLEQIYFCSGKECLDMCLKYNVKQFGMSKDGHWKGYDYQ